MKRLNTENNNSKKSWDMIYEFPELAPRYTSWLHPDIIHRTANAIPTDADVLDIGTGIGMAPFQVGRMRQDIRWFAVDHSKSALEYLKKHSSANWFGMLLWDITTGPLPFADKTFDVVMATEILEHLEHPTDLIEECARLASKVIIITVPNNDQQSPEYHLWGINSDDIHTFLDKYGDVSVYNVRDNQNLIGICRCK